MKTFALPVALMLATLGSIFMSNHADAQRARAVVDYETANIAAPLSPKARGELARQFVLRWGNHVERVYDVKVGIWARRMVPTFAAADSANFRNAMKRATFEGAVAELTGQGQQLSDQRALQRLAEAARSGKVPGKALGDIDRDLTYTPIQPCRILDTRSTVAGPIAAGATRHFVAIAGSYTSQGGSTGDCGTVGVVPSAVALNVTAVTPDRAGYATVFPFGATQPLASSVNYTAGTIVNNAIIAKVPNPLLSSDFSIFSYGQAHYVADIVGYFAPPPKRPLDCEYPTVTNSAVLPGNRSVAEVSCPLGYTAVGGGVSAFDKQGVTVNSTGPVAYGTVNLPWQWYSAATNNGASNNAFTHYAVCCRTAGR